MIGNLLDLITNKLNSAQVPASTTQTVSAPSEARVVSVPSGGQSTSFNPLTSVLQGMGSVFSEMENKKASAPILNPAFYNTDKAQNNASGSNASLDKSLNGAARKISGTSEGGATPQMFNFVDALKLKYPGLYKAGSSIIDFLRR